LVVEFEKPPAPTTLVADAEELPVTTLVLVLTGVTTMLVLVAVEDATAAVVELVLVLPTVVVLTVGVMLILPADAAAATDDDHAPQRALPLLWAATRSVGLQAEIRQEAPTASMAALPVVSHWQATSVGAQPALEMAEMRQAVAQGGSPERFCAVVRVRRTGRVERRMESCIFAGFCWREGYERRALSSFFWWNSIDGPVWWS